MKTIVVTGATRGLGAVTARRLAKPDHRLLVAGRDHDRVAGLVSELVDQCARVEGVVADFTEPDACDRVVDVAVEHFDTVHALVHVPGVRPHRSVEDLSVDDWDEVMDFNVGTLFRLTRRVLPLMKEAGWGRIVAFSGIRALSGQHSAHVAASKSAILGFCRSVAREYGVHGITANAIVPGSVSQGLDDRPPAPPWARGGSDEGSDLHDREGLRPVGRVGTGSEVAALVEYVVSDESGYLTGQALHLNGGIHFG